MAKGRGATRAVVYLGLGVGVLVILFILGLFISSKPYLPYDARSAQPDGTKALYMLLQQQGTAVSQVTTPVPQGRGLMIMLEPAGALDQQECQQVLAWVEQGNTVLVNSDDSVDVYPYLHCEFTPGITGKMDDSDSGVSNVYVNSQNPLLKDVRELTLTGHMRLKKHPDMTFSYGDEHGIYLAECRKGKGRIIFLTTSPDLFTNKAINQKDNLILFLNIVRLYGQEGTWFNDRSSAMAWKQQSASPLLDRSDFWKIFSWPWRLMTIQCMLVVLCLFYSWGKRFGRAVPLAKHVEQPAGDYVICLANIYRQARARQLVLDSIYQGFRQELEKYLGISPLLSDEELVRICSSRQCVDAEQLKYLLARCSGLLTRQNLREAELLEMARAIAIWQDSNLSFKGKRSKIHYG